MHVYLTKWMARFIRREQISRADLLEAIERAERGLIDADLSAGLIKQRIARKGKGRSGGYRTIIIFRRAYRAFFLFGFAKSQQENADPDELKTARELGQLLMAVSDDELARRLAAAELEEISDGNQDD